MFSVNEKKRKVISFIAYLQNICKLGRSWIKLNTLFLFSVVSLETPISVVQRTPLPQLRRDPGKPDRTFLKVPTRISSLF